MLINIFTLLYLLALTVLALVCVLAIVVYFQIKIFKKYSDLKKSNEHLRTEIADEENDIIASALKKAVEIEKSAEIKKEAINEILEKRLKEMIDGSLQKFQKTLSEMAADNRDRMALVALDFEKVALAEMKKEIAAKKEEELSKLQEKILTSVSLASREILGKAISPDEHEELIMEALQKAKKTIGNI